MQSLSVDAGDGERGTWLDEDSVFADGLWERTTVSGVIVASVNGVLMR